MPACGFVSLRVKPSPTPVRAVGTLRTGPVSAENEYLAMAIASNGTLTLTDKASGQVFTDLLTFEDRSEVGDGWFHGHSLNDELCLSTASAAQVSVVHDGPEMVSFRVTVTLTVPARYDSASEQPVGTGKRGLAFLSAGGLHEGGVADDRRRTMQVTLLRSFRKTVTTNGETDGLELGQIVHRYALMPFAGALPRSAALRELANPWIGSGCDSARARCR